jgi:hypothetical protein
MPAPAVDPATKEAVKAHALQHGIRPAAEHFGISVGTVMAWSAREKWLQSAHKTVQSLANPAQSLAATLPATMRPVAINACTPSEAARIAKLRKDAKTHGYAREAAHHGLKTAATVARAGSKRDATTAQQERALAIAQDAKAWASTAQLANVAGFERQQDRAGGVVVNLAILDRSTETVSTRESQ